MVPASGLCVDSRENAAQRHRERKQPSHPYRIQGKGWGGAGRLPWRGGIRFLFFLLWRHFRPFGPLCWSSAAAWQTRNEGEGMGCGSSSAVNPDGVVVAGADTAGALSGSGGETSNRAKKLAGGTVR